MNKIDLMTAITHEAGHCVMQWFVGREQNGFAFEVDHGQAINPSSYCPAPYEAGQSKSSVRKSVLVYYAGRAATQNDWPGSHHDAADFDEACYALAKHFSTVSQKLNGQWEVNEPEVNEFLQNTITLCNELIENANILCAIQHVVGIAVMSKPRDSEASEFRGRIEVTGCQINDICRAVITDGFRTSNKWSNRIEEN